MIEAIYARAKPWEKITPALLFAFTPERVFGLLMERLTVSK
jgi:hypothetical protein